MRLTVVVWRYWRTRGNLSEGRDALTAALALPGAVPTAIRADALWKLGYLLYFLGEYDAAREQLEQSAALFREAGDRLGESAALDSLGTMWLINRDLERSRNCYEQALAIRRERGARFEEGESLANLGMLAIHRIELGEARTLLSEALAISMELGAQREIANQHLSLGRVEFAEGNLAPAKDHVDRALRIYEDLGDQLATVPALTVLGQIAAELGETPRAISLLMASLRLRLKLGLYRNLGDFLERLASATVPLDPALASLLMAASAADREASGIPQLPWDEEAWERTLALARSALGATRFADAWREGQGLTLIAAAHEAETSLSTSIDTAIESPGALGELDGASSNPGLTPRELDVLRTLANGLSNQEIAAELYLSRSTVKRHVSNILGKLQVPSRSAAIARAHELDLIQADS